jgi:thiopurine S-methyltransferase
VELSPIACRAFFKENKRSYEISQKGAFTIFSGKNITLWCGDFFALKGEALKGISSVFDRAALVALSPPDRSLYAKHLVNLLKPVANVRVLLVTVEYDQALVEGPPFAVSETEVRQLFSNSFNIELRDRHEDTDLKYGHPKFKGVSDLSECIFVMDRR